MASATDAAKAAAEHGSGGAVFPPFDFTTFVPQLFWLAVTFTILYVVLARVALPRIAAVLEERRDKIADDLDKAEELRREAEASLAAYEKAIADARANAARIVGDARADIKAESDARLAEVEAEITGLVSAAEERISATKTAAISEMRGVAVEIASDITTRLLGSAPPQTVVEQAVDSKMSSAA